MQIFNYTVRKEGTIGEVVHGDKITIKKKQTHQSRDAGKNNVSKLLFLKLQDTWLPGIKRAGSTLENFPLEKLKSSTGKKLLILRVEESLRNDPFSHPSVKPIHTELLIDFLLLHT